jgi:hypothetical protein
MADVVSIEVRRADTEMTRLLDIMEAGGVCVFLHVPGTELLPTALAFEFYKGSPTPEAIEAACQAVEKYGSGDAAFKEAVSNYLFNVGATYKPAS